MTDRKAIQNPGIGRGAPGVPRSPSLSRSQIQLVRDLVYMQLSTSEIARRLGVSRDQVRTIRRHDAGELSRPSRSQRCA